MFLLSIFNSNRRSFLHFFLAMIGVFVIMVLCFEFILYRLDETLSYKKIIQLQKIKQELYSTKYFETYRNYKICGLNECKANTIALGTSRIMSLRQSHFIDNRKFYNAGVAASISDGFDGMMEILESLNKESLPKKIIVGIDPWVFNPNYQGNKSTTKSRLLNIVKHNSFLRCLYDTYIFIKRRCAAYNLIVQEKHNVIPFLLFPRKTSGIGLNAKIFNTGFDVNGSFSYPSDLKDTEIKNQDQWNDFFASHYRFTPAFQLDKKIIIKFKRFLTYCRNRNIIVTGILLPFRNDFYNALIKSSNQAEFFSKFRNVIPQIMSEMDFKCHDFSSPESLGLTVKDFHDYIHAKKHVFKKILSKI